MKTAAFNTFAIATPAYGPAAVASASRALGHAPTTLDSLRGEQYDPTPPGRGNA